jgi:hypothetical protein
VSDSDSLTIQYQFNAVQGDGRYGPLLIEDTLLREIPGEPVIPYYTAQILLPQGTEIKDVKVKTSVPVEQTGYEIPWGQPPSIFGDTPEKVSKNEEIYNSNQWYPQEIYEVISTESFRGFQILLVNLYPVQYQPKSGTVKFYETLTVEVKVKKGTKNPLYRGLPDDKQEVAGIVDNPEMVQTYEDSPQPMIYQEYIIITNEALLPTFEQLAAWKKNYVSMVDNVYTVSAFLITFPGRDDQ